jgi:hypothetical protein
VLASSSSASAVAGSRDQTGSHLKKPAPSRRPSHIRIRKEAVSFRSSASHTRPFWKWRKHETHDVAQCLGQSKTSRQLNSSTTTSAQRCGNRLTPVERYPSRPERKHFIRISGHRDTRRSQDTHRRYAGHTRIARIAEKLEASHRVHHSADAEDAK